MFGLFEDFWSWTGVVITVPGNVCVDARSPNAVAVSAHAIAKVDVTARRADDCEC